MCSSDLRMQRIEESLGLAGIQAPEDLIVEKHSSPVGSEHETKV